MRTLNMTSAMLGVAFVLAASGASATDLTVCVKVLTEYEDSGNGENRYTDPNPRYRLAPGMRTLVYRNGSTVFNGWLGGSGSSEGCTPAFSVAPGSAVFQVRILSKGYVGANNYVRGETYVPGQEQSPEADYSATASSWFIAGPTQLKTVSLDPMDSRFNAYVAAAYSFATEGAGTSNETYRVKVGASSSIEYINGVNLLASHADNKFVIAHELGHSVSRRIYAEPDLKGWTVGLSSLTEADRETCTRQPISSGHNMRSKEYGATAMNEGFGHFFAAAVWNLDTTSSCSFTYYKAFNGNSMPVINCEWESPGNDWGVRFMENKCGSNHAGKSTEIDYLRQFWDMRTDYSNSPSLEGIGDWISDAAPFISADRVYNELDAQANFIGGGLNTAWDGRKDDNAVDYPGPCVVTSTENCP